MFHIELRRFPHVARGFNLAEEALERRVLKPWIAGAAVQWNERSWPPERTRLTIYEGPELRTDQLGLGRGWAEVTRTGNEVTTELLERARGSERAGLERVREEIVRRCSAQTLTFEEVAALAGDDALAERAVIELLHEGRLRLVGGSGRG